MSLVARHLEENGLPTVVLGSARDIVEHCGAPRFLFTDFPLGNSCGKPWDRSMQRRIVASALDLLETAREPRTTRQAPYVWDDDESWRQTYLQVDPAVLDELRQRGDQRRQRQLKNKKEGRVRVE